MWVGGKLHFSRVARNFSVVRNGPTLDFKVVLISVGYSWSFTAVRCTANFSLEVRRNHFLWVARNPQIIGLIMLLCLWDIPFFRNLCKAWPNFWTDLLEKRISRNTFHRGIDTLLAFSRKFCKFEVNTMDTDFSLCESLEKSIFNSCPRELKA